MKELNVKIIVATHKSYEMPNDSIYLPVQVGAEGKEDLGYTRDNTGDNISALNSRFCELTGLYWAWKNLDADYIGLAHYRRHFSKNGEILTGKDLETILRSHKIVVPKKRKYYIETIYSHYAHTFDAEHLDITRDIIERNCPEYIKAFDKVMKSRGAYMFNMMIMDKQLADKYCAWLFDILFELNDKIDTKGMTVFQGRYVGRIGERLFNVWLDHQLETGEINKSDIKEIPYIYMEKIDWGKKISSFLKAKFIHKQYEKSF